MIGPNGGEVRLRGRQFVSLGAGYNWGTNVQFGAADVTTNGNVQVLKLQNIAVAAGSAGVALYLYDGVATDFRVLAMWATRGATIGDRPPVRRSNVVSDKLSSDAAGMTYADELAKAAWATTYGPVWSANDLVGSGLTGESQTSRTYLFGGFGEVIVPPAQPINALEATLAMATGGPQAPALVSKPWIKIAALVRTAASDAHAVGATTLAVGEVDVDPAETTLGKITIPLRDPVTGNLLVDGIDPADYQAEVFHAVYAIAADGNAGTINQFNGTRTDRVDPPRAYYLRSDRNGRTGDWLEITSSAAIGIEHRFLQDLDSGYQPSDDLRRQLGAEGNLVPRIDVALTDYGVPRGAAWRPELLVDWHRFRAMRLAGANEQFDVAIVGDSWSDRRQRFVEAVTNAMIAELGDAGPGWIGFGINSGAVAGNARGLYSVVVSGTWASDYGTAASPNISNARSSSPGAKLTITAAGATAVLASVRLFWTGTADGVVRYRWNAGAWTNQNVQGSGFQSALLAGVPGGANWTLEIEVVSGSVNLQGVDGRSAAPGVRVHKLSNSGSSAARWIAVDEANFVAAIAQIAPKLALVCLATNDRAAGTSPDTFRVNLNTLIGRLKAAAATADLLLMAPCENERADAHPMTAYTNAMGRVADDRNAAMLDLQYAFGMDVNVYKQGGARPWFSDNVHPVDASVAPIIPTALQRVLQPS